MKNSTFFSFLRSCFEDILYFLYEFAFGDSLRNSIKFLLTIFIIYYFCFWLIYISRETPDETIAIYNAWCKLNYRQDLSIEEWKALRNSHLLPDTKNNLLPDMKRLEK